jgi:copper transport protein
MPVTSTPNKCSKLLLIALGLVLFWQLAPARAALAHANLVRAAPAPNAVLVTAPGQVTIWFTEPLEPQFGEIQVLDGSGRRVDNGDSTVGPQDATMVTVTLPPLDDGTYTVAWSNVSTVDGHKVRGSYVFSVGQPIGAAAAGVVDQPLLQSPLEPALRWLTLLSIMAIVGGLIFQLLVMQPALREAGPAPVFRQAAETVRRRSFKLYWIAWVLLLTASIAHLLLQTTIAYELSLWQAIGRPLGMLLFATSWGQLWLWRLALLLAVAIFLWLAGRHDQTDARPRDNRYERLALAAGLGILLTLSLSSHAAATVQIQAAAVFNDYLHLLAATFWAGGLLHLLLAFPVIRAHLNPRQQRELLAAAVPRFSRLAILSVAVLAVTGLYSSWAQVTVPAALATPYGRTLLAKLVLVALVLLLAAANFFWIRPRLSREDQAGRQLGRLVAGEVALALLILLLVGLLTALEPARQVASRLGLGQQDQLVFEETIEGATIELAISPGQAGPNQLAITLTDRRGQPIDNADDVSLRATFLEQDLGDSSVSATNLGDGQYLADGVMLSLAGPWQVALAVRRPDAFDARTAFRFEIEPGLVGGSAAIAPEPAAGRLLWAVELAMLGLALTGLGLVALRRGKQRQAVAIAPGIAALVAAIFVAVSAGSGEMAIAQAPDGELPRAEEDVIGGNPFPPDTVSLAAGQQVYEEHCMICHGLTGHGDGPRSAGIDAVDIIEHVPLHTDLEYFEIVPAHGERGDLSYSTSAVTDEDIWHLVNYLHAFETDQLLAEDYLAQARDLAEQGDYAGALSLLDQVIELSPRFVLALQGRSIMAMDQGDTAQAIADLDRVVVLDPTYADGFYYRAEAYRLSGQLTEAIADYSQAIVLEPEHSDALYARGVLQASNGAQDKAVADLQRFLEVEPQSGDRAAVEALIAQLQGVGTAPGGDQTAAPTLALVDLPAGFEPLPPASLGLVAGGPIAIGTTIASSFAFGHSEHFELLAGYTTPLAGEAEQQTFDSYLTGEDLLAFLSDGLGAEEILESAPLPAPDGLGDASTGVTAVFNTEGRQSRVDGLAFRRAEVGALLFVVYRDGGTPLIALHELATTLAESITP